MKSIEEIEECLREANAKLVSVEADIRSAICYRMDKEHAPLLEKAALIKTKIIQEVHSAFYEKEQPLKESIEQLKEELRVAKIQYSLNLWYAPGTIVYQWQRVKNNTTWAKTGRTGIVVIYDGTQYFPRHTARLNMPKFGDVLVCHHKRGGELSVKYDLITRHGRLIANHKMWLKEGDIPNK